MTFIDGPHFSNQDGMQAPSLALLCKVLFRSICCSVDLASCCSGCVSSQYLTSMMCTSQREGCFAWISLRWILYVPAVTLQIASGLKQGRSLFAESFGRNHWDRALLATCAGKTRLCWAIPASLPIAVKMIFPPRSPLLKGLMISLEAMFSFSVTMFWIEAFKKFWINWIKMLSTTTCPLIMQN